MEIRVGLAFATSGHCSWRLLSKTATDCGPSSSKKLLLHTTAEEEEKPTTINKMTVASLDKNMCVRQLKRFIFSMITSVQCSCHHTEIW